MIWICDTFNPCDLFPYHFHTIAPFHKRRCFKPHLYSSFSNRLWAHTKQEKEYCVDIINSEVFYVKKDNHLMKLNVFFFSTPNKWKLEEIFSNVWRFFCWCFVLWHIPTKRERFEMRSSNTKKFSNSNFLACNFI